MLKRPGFLALYFLAWVSFFELARIYFLFSTTAYAKDVSGNLIMRSLWFGLKMDISMAAYFTSFAGLLVLLGLFIPVFNKRKVFFIYTGILLFIELLMVFADAEIFKAWGTRIDITPLKYLSNPREVWASISHLPIALLIIGFVIIFLLIFWLFRKYISRNIHLLSYTNNRIPQALLNLVLIGLLIIPIRGGFQLSPLNQSSVFFSNNQYANNAAVNASWNFMYSVTLMDQLGHNPYIYMDETEASGIVKELYISENKNEQVVDLSNPKLPNVIFIVWESFTEKALNKLVDNKPIISYFPQLFKDGIYFSNCYSSGDRTDKGISAILSGYPSLPKGSIVNYPSKTANFHGLSKSFQEHSYSTHFYYGGEPEFANIKSYITAQNFQYLVTKNNFQEADMNSKWGAHDNIVMHKLLNDISTIPQPFFTTWLTLSSHEPFETPVSPYFYGSDKETKFYNSLHFSDSVIFSFITELKKRPVWDNTVLIISADHGHYLPITGKRADDYRIPVLWLGGALNKRDTVISKTVDQIDMAGSLLDQFLFSSNSFIYGKNVFDSSSQHWAFFTYNDGIGFVTDSSRILFDNAGKKIVFSEGITTQNQEKTAKAIMQNLYSDFLNR